MVKTPLKTPATATRVLDREEGNLLNAFNGVDKTTGNLHPQPRCGGQTKLGDKTVFWVGGSSLKELKRPMATSMNQLRTTMDIKVAKQTEKEACEGMKEKMRLHEPGVKDNDELTHWLDKVSAHCEDFGMDSLLRMVLDEGGEINLLKDFKWFKNKDLIKD